MQIILDIPDTEIPKNQDLLNIDIHFIDKDACEVKTNNGTECGFKVLPKGHGRLYDIDMLIKHYSGFEMLDGQINGEYIFPPVLEADIEDEEE